MFTINHSTPKDIEDILSIDTYIPRHELEKKVATRPEAGSPASIATRWDRFESLYICSNACRVG